MAQEHYCGAALAPPGPFALPTHGVGHLAAGGMQAAARGLRACAAWIVGRTVTQSAGVAGGVHEGSLVLTPSGISKTLSFHPRQRGQRKRRCLLLGLAEQLA
jgi:hypothetical protein